MAGAAEEVSRSWLGGLPVDAQANVSTSDEQGALVNVTAGTRPMQAGLFMAADAAQALAKLFVGLEPSDDDLPMSDIGDALCELANVLAGAMKRRLNGDAGLAMGLPLFYGSGRPQHPGVDAASQPLTIGEFSVVLLVIG